MLWVFGFAVIAIAGCARVQSNSSQRFSPVTGTLVLEKEFGKFTDAVAISIDQFGNSYVVDRGASAITKFNAAGDSIRAVSGVGRGQNQFDAPSDVYARFSNFVFVADYGNHRIAEFSKDLTYITTLYTREDADPNNRFGYPLAIAGDDAANIFFIDGENKRVIRATSDLTIQQSIGAYSNDSRSDGVLVNPTDVAIDGDNHIIVLDQRGTSLKCYDSFGSVVSRRTLNMKVVAITCSNDTLLTLTENGHVLLYNTRSLNEIGWWNTPNTATPWLGIVSGTGGIFLLNQHVALRCKLNSRTE
jgi:hypothetical protein